MIDDGPWQWLTMALNGDWRWSLTMIDDGPWRWPFLPSFFFPRPSPPGDRWCHVIGFVHAGSVSSSATFLIFWDAGHLRWLFCPHTTVSRFYQYWGFCVLSMMLVSTKFLLILVNESPDHRAGIWSNMLWRPPTPSKRRGGWNLCNTIQGAPSRKFPFWVVVHIQYSMNIRIKYWTVQ